MKKRISLVIVSILMVLCTATGALAGGHEKDPSDIEGLTVFDGAVSSLYEITCPGGKHDMKSNGIGTALDGSGKTVFRGFCYQCQNCYLVLCSESDPYFSRTLGRYCFYMAYEPIGTVGCTVKNAKIETFTGDVRFDSFWQGFVFRKGA